MRKPDSERKPIAAATSDTGDGTTEGTRPRPRVRRTTWGTAVSTSRSSRSYKTGYTDPNGLPHESFEIEYFPDGLTTSITLDGPLTASRTYNALGQVIETVDTAGGTTTYRYDGRGHLILIRDPAATTPA